jgi:hypothetical protein
LGRWPSPAGAAETPDGPLNRQVLAQHLLVLHVYKATQQTDKLQEYYT